MKMSKLHLAFLYLIPISGFAVEPQEVVKGILEARSSFDALHYRFESPFSNSVDDHYIPDTKNVSSIVSVSRSKIGKIELESLIWVKDGVELAYIESVDKVVKVRSKSPRPGETFGYDLSMLLIANGDFDALWSSLSRHLKNWRVEKGDEGGYLLEAKFSEELDDLLDPNDQADYDFQLEVDKNFGITGYNIAQGGGFLRTLVKVISSDKSVVRDSTPVVPVTKPVEESMTYMDLIETILKTQ